MKAIVKIVGRTYTYCNTLKMANPLDLVSIHSVQEELSLSTAHRRRLNRRCNLICETYSIDKIAGFYKDGRATVYTSNYPKFVYSAALEIGDNKTCVADLGTSDTWIEAIMQQFFLRDISFQEDKPKVVKPKVIPTVESSVKRLNKRSKSKTTPIPKRNPKRARNVKVFPERNDALTGANVAALFGNTATKPRVRRTFKQEHLFEPTYCPTRLDGNHSCRNYFNAGAFDQVSVLQLRVAYGLMTDRGEALEFGTYIGGIMDELGYEAREIIQAHPVLQPYDSHTYPRFVLESAIRSRSCHSPYHHTGPVTNKLRVRRVSRHNCERGYALLDIYKDYIKQYNAQLEFDKDLTNDTLVY